MEGMPEKIDSKFRFVLIAAHRAEQMMLGAPTKVESESQKVTTLALEEVLADRVDWDYGPAEVEAIDEEAAEGEPGESS